MMCIRLFSLCPTEPRYGKGKTRAESSSGAKSKNPLPDNTHSVGELEHLVEQAAARLPVDYDPSWNFIQELTGVDDLKVAALQFVLGMGVIAGLTLLLCSELYIVGLSIFGSALFLLIVSSQWNHYLEHQNTEKFNSAHSKYQGHLIHHAPIQYPSHCTTC